MIQELSSRVGVALSIVSSCLFAGMYYYATLLAPLNGHEIFGWRLLLTLPCVTIFMLVAGQWQGVVELFGRIRRTPMLLIGILLSSALLGAQQLLFLWAPLNGRGLNVSLGYFLLPLVMVLVGRVVYRERLSRLQKIAPLLAGLGVAHELYQVGSVSWETMLVALGFPVYFLVRRKMRTDHLGGLWFDMLFMCPIAGWLVLGQDAAEHFAHAPRLYWMIGLLGVIGAAAFMCYTAATRVLPFGLFGLLGYVEPVLMLGASLMIGESIEAHEWMTYVPIWAAICCLVLDGIQHVRRASASSGATAGTSEAATPGGRSA